jgi:DNA-binding MarR family transcriptional regulator
MKRAANTAMGELTDSLDFLIRDTRLLLTGHIESRISRLNIPLRIWFPLRVLHRNEGLTQRELGRYLGYGDARAGVIVGVLLRRKLVSRRQSSQDKRRIDLYLTPAGRKMAQQIVRQSTAINARIVSGFSATEVQTLKALLLRVHENLKTS